MAKDKKSVVLSRALDVGLALVAYVVARLVWGRRETLDALHLELLTFALVYGLLQLVVRGHRLARLGREP